MSKLPTTAASSSRTPTSTFPSRPNLEFLRKLAKDRLREQLVAVPEAKLHTSQLALAREYGFGSWRALVAHLTPAAAHSTVVRTGARVEIAGVPPLAWGKETAVTFVGALAAALKAFGPYSHDVPTLMGDSALGFRVRWWSSDDFTRQCPSGPVGEFEPWTAFAADSVGWTLRWEAAEHDAPKSPDDPQDMTPFQDEVLAHLDAGRPILAYINSWDLGVLYGYDTAGDKTIFLARDYRVGDKEFLAPLTDLRGLLAFFEDRRPVPPRSVSITRALAEAVEAWTRPPQRGRRQGHDGAYYYGLAAYDRWLDVLPRSEAFDEPALHNLLHVHFWSFVSLIASREQAPVYLRAAQKHLPAATHPYLESAARAAEALVRVAGEAVKEEGLFPPFFLPESLPRWTAANRLRCIPVLETARSHDAAMHSHLREALALL